MRPLIAGNWKMNGVDKSLVEISAVAQWVAENEPNAEVLIFPPFTLVTRAAMAASNRIGIGGQDCHAQPSGAFTGDVSAEMLADAGAVGVIVGHSERRRACNLTDAEVLAKARAAWRAGLLAIICVGETGEQHDAGRAQDVVIAQLDGSIPPAPNPTTTVVAYEPVWAIGTGRTPSSDQISRMHACIRDHLEERYGEGGSHLRILYGGSVTASNSAAILAIPNVDGALVGGASLKAGEFTGIVQASAGSSSLRAPFAL
jgi:triosephosphate isomerase